MLSSKQIKTIDAFIRPFPKGVQFILEQIREIIKKAAPGAIEAIKYGIPTFVLNGKNLIHFSGYKTHIGFYPGSSAILVFKKDLAKYEVSKGTIRFPLGKPLPLGLIKKIVKYRVKENLLKAK
jgi:uncharacterized protein YdhG (YjbR/CyaY superfamily)